MSLDYRDFEKNGKTKPNAAINKQWWKSDIKDRGSDVTAAVKQIYDNDNIRRNQLQTSMRLYGSVNPMGLAGIGAYQMPVAQIPTRDRLTYNVIQSAGDAVGAKIAKNKPKPMFLTSGGSYKNQRKAKKLDKFVEGVFYENDAYQLGQECFTDAYVMGDGLIQVYAHEGRVKYDRVLSGELYVDRKESRYGKPRQLHRIKDVDREVLIELFPDKKDLILTSNNVGLSSTALNTNISDQLVVIESWHLPSGKGAKDGLHTINILGGDNLLDEEWTKPYFPFAKLTWSKRQEGYWGQGGAEQIQPIQLEINKILWTMQRSYQLSGSFKIWAKIGSKIVKEHLNNEVGTIIESDDEPKYLVPPIIPPEMYSQLKELKNSAFEVIGASQLSATSQLPAGVQSGKAMRTLNNIETERFMVLGQAYEHFFLQLSRLTVDCARDIYESEGELNVKSVNSRFIQSIDWKDAALDDEDMVLQMFPVSSLSNDPSERLQDVQEWVQAGWITPRTAKRLMSFPDTEAETELDDAKEDYLHMIIEKMIDDGEFTPPEPYDDLPLAKELFLDYYAWAKVNGVEDEKLELLRNFNEQVELLVQKSMPPPMPQGAPGAPQANPVPPPQSDLIQNTPQAA